MAAAKKLKMSLEDAVLVVGTSQNFSNLYSLDIHGQDGKKLSLGDNCSSLLYRGIDNKERMLCHIGTSGIYYKTFYASNLFTELGSACHCR